MEGMELWPFRDSLFLDGSVDSLTIKHKWQDSGRISCFHDLASRTLGATVPQLVVYSDDAPLDLVT